MNASSQFSRRRFTATAAAMAVAALAGLCGPAMAQSNYPTRPVTIILPFGTGGVSDIAARLISEKLEDSLGQRFLIDNQPGANSAVATQKAFKGDKEGYTLLNMGNAATIRRTLMPNQRPDPISDFQPISPVAEFGLVLVAAPQSGIESVQDLVKKAKANPGTINIGSVAVGSTQHLSSLLFATVAGIKVEIVTYNSTPELMGAVARGEVDAALEIVSGAMSPIKTKQVKLIATTRSKRSPVYPDTPTVEESGVAPFDVSSWNSYVAPKGVPNQVVQKLNAEIQRIIDQPEVREKMLSFGMEPFHGGPDAVSKRNGSDIAKWEAVIKAAGMPIEQ
jgi:tripartite-type tricarboxylate transporter receptor subunit TctC